MVHLKRYFLFLFISLYLIVEKELPKFGKPVVIDLNEEEEEIVLKDIRITNYAAPMDFDGTRILYFTYF